MMDTRNKKEHTHIPHMHTHTHLFGKRDIEKHSQERKRV